MSKIKTLEAIYKNYYDVLNIFDEHCFLKKINNKRKKFYILKFDCKNKNIIEKIAKEYNIQIFKTSLEYAPEIVNYCFII